MDREGKQFTASQFPNVRKKENTMRFMIGLNLPNGKNFGYYLEGTDDDVRNELAEIRAEGFDCYS